MFEIKNNVRKKTIWSITIILTMVFLSIILSQSLKNNYSEATTNLITSDSETNDSVKIKIDTNNKPYLLLLVASNSCECTVERGKEAEALLKEIKDEIEAEIKIDVVDYAEDEDKLNDYADYFEVSYIPALLFFTPEGVFKGKLEFEIKKEEVLKKIEELIKKE